MTSGDHPLQDAELDEFLAGRDDLSRQLAALTQPEAPRQVNDAIMASIQAQLTQEQAARITHVTPRPAANMARWRAPAALAASLVGALLLTLEWQRGDYAQQAQTVAPAQPTPATTPAPAPVQQPKVPPSSQVASPPPSAAPPATAPRARPAAKKAPPMRADVDQALPPIALTPPAGQFLRAPANAPLSYAARSEPLMRAPAPIAMPAPADAARAANWLHVIDEMLKADLRQEALEEWRKFRLDYPDYPVPEELTRQIDAIH